MNWQKLYNPIMSVLLRSPLHSLISKNVLLLTVTGRKSSNRYTTPVNYLRDGESLLISSSRDRSWWKNLRGGAPVTMRLQGKRLRGRGEAFEDEEAVAEGLLTFVQQVPAYQKYLRIELTSDGRPADPEQLAQATRDRVIVRISDLTPE